MTLENPTVAEGTLDSASATGTTTEAAPLAGNYELCVRGTWMNRGLDLIDAEYVSQDNWVTHSDGLPASDPLSATLGPNFGDVTVNGAFIDWGAYNTEHKYCTVVTLAQGDTLTLAVNDGNVAVAYYEAGRVKMAYLSRDGIGARRRRWRWRP